MFPQRLTEGYRAFLSERLPRERIRYRAVAERQRPQVMVIGCCDSRVSPEVIFDASPGEIFVARNVANLVPPYETAGLYHGASAAVEFAVQALKVQHIVVLGHARCGGIQTYIEHGVDHSDFIGHWLSLLTPAAQGVVSTVPAERMRALEFATVALSLGNLMTFPWVQALVEQGKLKLHGAYFGVGDGVLLVRDAATGKFEPLVRD